MTLKSTRLRLYRVPSAPTPLMPGVGILASQRVVFEGPWELPRPLAPQGTCGDRKGVGEHGVSALGGAQQPLRVPAGAGAGLGRASHWAIPGRSPVSLGSSPQCQERLMKRQWAAAAGARREERSDQSS